MAMAKTSLMRVLAIAGLAALLLGHATQAFAATCTSKANGNWGNSSTWTCTGTPTATVPSGNDSAILASPYTVTLDNDYQVIGFTINSGATLSDGNGHVLTVSGNIINNGTFTSSQSGIIASTGNAAVMSGSGTFANQARLYTSGTGPSIAAGSTLTFTGTAQIRTGRDDQGNTVSNSVLTINGTLNATAQTGGSSTPFLRLYASSTVVGSSGVINASGTATISYRSTGTFTNNGSVTVATVSVSSGTGTWTNAANASLTVTSSFAPSTLNASASGNTVTYTSPAHPVTPSSNTYYNLAGSGVVCPVSYTILGTSPCATTPYVQGSPSSCTSVTGVGSVAWSNPGNATSSDNVYATSSLSSGTTSNYLKCTGFGLNVPAGAVIKGITVTIERKTSGGTMKDAYVYLIKNGSISTALNAATSTSYGTNDSSEAHGGQTTLWGSAWTTTDLNSTNFGVAFAAQNTGSSNWCWWGCTYSASVDQIVVRVDYSVSGLHHIRIEHDSVAAYCLSEPITLKACANAACTSYYTASDVTGIGLSPSSTGNTWSPSSTATITAASGGINTGNITLAHSSAGTVSLGITGTASPAPTNAFECYNTGTGSSGNVGSSSCDLVFSNGAFSFHVPDHVSATAQTVSMTSCASSMASGSRSVSFWTTYVDPSSGTLKANVAAGSSNANCTSGSSVGTASGSATTVALTFGSGTSPQASFTLCYPDVGRVQLNASYSSGGTTITGASSFVARPDHFTVTGIKRTSDNLANPAAADATGGAFVAAGNSAVAATQFTAKISAVNALNAVTPNFGVESSPEGVVLSVGTVVAPSGGNPGLLTCKASTSGCSVPGGAANFSAGATTVTDLAWNEVGVINLLPALTDGSYMGTADLASATASGNIGRFYPHHFGVIPDPAAAVENRAELCLGGFLVADHVTACAPTFSYMGEPMNLNFQLLAQEAGGLTTRNYIYSSTVAQNFSKLNLTSNAALHLGAVNDPTGTPNYLTARLDTTSLVVSGTPVGTFLVGVADVTAPIVFPRASAAPLVDGPYATLSFGIAPLDSDGVAMGSAALDLATTSAAAGSDHALIDSSELRYGRLRLQNAYGSELLDLPMSFTAQYWNGSGWSLNSLDTDTTSTLSFAAVGSNNITSNTCIIESGNNSGKGCAAAPAVASRAYLQGGVAGFAGNFNLWLKAPGTGHAGSIDITAAAPTWLRYNWTGTQANPGARATFGIFKSPLIYRRENY